MSILTAQKLYPVPGFAVELEDESNLFKWIVYIEGPEGSPFEKGIFKAVLKFPYEYPYQPPSLTFVSPFWHPNVYKDGKVCISILHPPGEDALSGETPEERWLPIQTPQSILLSVSLLLNEPSGSPANVDANVEYKKDRESFNKRAKILVEKSLKELPKDFVMPKKKENFRSPKLDMSDFYQEAYQEEEEDDSVKTEDLELSDSE